MKVIQFLSTTAAACGLSVCVAMAGAPSALSSRTLVSSTTPVSGAYVEARNADVFIGGCHFGSEYQSMGRDAILAWHPEKGYRDGVSLANLTIVAVVAGDNNLAEASTHRSSILYVDNRATPEQASALVSMAKELAAKSLGQVKETQSSPIRYHARGDEFHVQVPGVADLDASRLADRRCCTMRYDVWYKPLAPVQNPIVGCTLKNVYTGAALHTTWDVPGQNSAFIGEFKATN